MRLSAVRRARLYAALARLIDAGVPYDAALRSLRSALRDPATQRVLSALEAALERHDGLAAGLDAARPDIPAFHARALGAAERSGSPGRTLRGLAEAEEAQDKARRELLQRVAYPVFVLHLALVAPATGLLLVAPGKTVAMLLAVALPIDAALALGYLLLTRPGDSPAASRLALRLPALGRVLRDQEHGRYLLAVHQLYEAGVSLPSAAEEALPAAQTPTVTHELSTIPQHLREGAPLASALPFVTALRPEIAALLATAEPAGELGPALGDAGRLATELGLDGGKRLARRVTSTVYAAVVVYVAWTVLSFYADYFGRFSPR